MVPYTYFPMSNIKCKNGLHFCQTPSSSISNYFLNISGYFKTRDGDRPQHLVDKLVFIIQKCYIQNVQYIFSCKEEKRNEISNFRIKNCISSPQKGLFLFGCTEKNLYCYLFFNLLVSSPNLNVNVCLYLSLATRECLAIFYYYYPRQFRINHLQIRRQSQLLCY